MSEQIQDKATQEQVLYAKILEVGMYAGLGLMIVTFILYILGIVEPVVPLNEIASYWSQPVDQYLAAINANFLHWEHPPTGWAWLKLLGTGDFLNFLPIAILAGVTIVCYLAIMPGLFQRKDTAMAIMTAATAAILILAASGLLTVGH
ncbi:MAG: hypothetical protein U5J62_00765 [Desulfurivibrio sp.]|nr:hypothetical protein [Desulfurivibrio sp.]